MQPKQTNPCPFLGPTPRLQVTQLMVPLLKFYFHEEVRRAATSALPQLLRATQAAAEKGVQGATQVGSMGLVGQGGGGGIQQCWRVAIGVLPQLLHAAQSPAEKGVQGASHIDSKGGLLTEIMHAKTVA